jgi:hypothetical protein
VRGLAFEVHSLRIRALGIGGKVVVAQLSLVDAHELRAELDACIAALTSKLDVKLPPPRSGSGE